MSASDVPPHKTLEDLQWSRIEQAIADRCRGPLSTRLHLSFAATADETSTALAETAEAMMLMASGDALPLDSIREIRGHLDRLERHGVLDSPSLHDVQVTLSAARKLRLFLGRRRLQVPRLAAACPLDPTLDHLEEEIAGIIEPDGTIADSASPELRQLRAEVANIRARIVARLEEFIHRHPDVLQDRYYTVREGRYVLPVRRDTHENVAGIVHGTSSSGATAFIEPRALVAQGNRLKIAQAELEREEARILAALSELVRERAAEVRSAAETLDHADLRSASARFGRDFGGVVVELDDKPRVDLRRVRHPVLLLEGVDVVPNDVELEGGHALVISGPNAGGKTVVLKSLGLTALMVRAGIPVPCEEGSRCGFFRQVLTDIGDDQSLSANLSTFSAHVTNIVRILASAGRHTMVLLDELAGGTDPEEGAALACALVDALCGHGSAVAVTTHYEALKAMGAADPRLRNASVGFDMQRMAPTFELRMDLPGASSALAVAARFGVAPKIIENARRMLPEQSSQFHALLADYERRVAEATKVRQDLERERAEIAELRATIEREREAMRHDAREELGSAAKDLRDRLRKGRQDLDEARKKLRAAEVAKADLTDARAAFAHAAEAVADAEAATAPQRAPQTPLRDTQEPLRVGDRVWIARLQTEGEVIEPVARGRVRVATGAIKLWVDETEARPVEQRAKGRDEPRVRVRIPHIAPSDIDISIDVRGMRGEDAVALVDTFLDRLFGASQSLGYIVHGIGSGTLRDVIRSHLRTDKTRVQSVRTGTPEEGGERVTVVTLK